MSFSVSERNVSSQLGEGVSVPCVSLQTAIARIGNHASVKSDIEGAEFLYDDFRGIDEMVGEVHPEKAGSTNEHFKEILSRGFKTVTMMGEGKCLFRAV